LHQIPQRRPARHDRRHRTQTHGLRPRHANRGVCGEGNELGAGGVKESERKDVPAVFDYMLLTERIPATIEDYEKLPEKAPYQLIGGELVMSPSPTPFHQGILDNFVFALGTFVRANNLGRIFVAPLDVRFSDYDVFQPDLIF